MSNLDGAEDASALDGALQRLTTLARSRAPAEVIALCDEVEVTFGPHFEICHHRAHARAIMGDKSGAIADLSRGIALRPEEPALFYFRGLWQLDTGDPLGASHDFSSAIALETAMGSSYYLRSARFARAIASLGLREFDQALSDCRAVDGDMRAFVAGRLWSVEDILNAMPSNLRPT